MRPLYLVSVLPLIGLLAWSVGPAFGQDYPNKPVRVIVPSPGGGSDFAARIIVQAISGPLGQPVVIDYAAVA